MNKDFAGNNTELIKRIAAGDETARKRLVEENMGLVHSVVGHFLKRGAESEDLFQIGCVGLVRAAERFDVKFDVRFSTYAVPMIIGEIKRFLRDDGIIKISRSVKELSKKANELREKIIKETGREPRVSELAEKLGVSQYELASALESEASVQSIYIKSDENDSRELLEKIESDEDLIGDMINKVTLKQTIAELEEREQKIVCLRYFRQYTQTDVAKVLKISQVQVSRLEKSILLKMRKKIEDT